MEKTQYSRFLHLSMQNSGEKRNYFSHKQGVNSFYVQKKTRHVAPSTSAFHKLLENRAVKCSFIGSVSCLHGRRFLLSLPSVPSSTSASSPEMGPYISSLHSLRYQCRNMVHYSVIAVAVDKSITQSIFLRVPVNGVSPRYRGRAADQC